MASPDILRLTAGWLMSIILENEETSVSVFVCHFVLCVIRKCFDGVGSLSVCTSHFAFTAGWPVSIILEKRGTIVPV